MSKKGTRVDIARIVARGTGLQIHETSAVIEGFMRCVIDQLKLGKKLEFRGFGVFEVRHFDERVGRDVRKNQQMIVPARWKPRLRFSPDVRREINEAIMQAQEIPANHINEDDPRKDR